MVRRWLKWAPTISATRFVVGVRRTSRPMGWPFCRFTVTPEALVLTGRPRLWVRSVSVRRDDIVRVTIKVRFRAPIVVVETIGPVGQPIVVDAPWTQKVVNALRACEYPVNDERARLDRLWDR
jgi:hypothetical protein